MEDVYVRLKSFAIETIKFTQTIPRNPGINRIADQLIGAGTSPAANSQEALAARSKAEFISTLGISLKELREAMFWLEITQELQWGNKDRRSWLLQECSELGKIVATIILKTKQSISK